MALSWVGVIGGKLMFSVAPANGFHLFAVASIAVGLSLVPIALTTGAAPTIPRPARLGLRELYRTAPVGLVGCIAIGLANGAFWTFAPLFAQARSGSSLGISLFMTACVLGGALSQWPIGRLSDNVDRRWVIFGACLVSAAAGVLLTLNAEGASAVLMILAALFGGSSLSIYSVCVAHTNDRADPATYVEVSSHLLLAFGLGATVGPFLASFVISGLGVTRLFAFTSAVHVGLAVFVLARLKLTPAAAEAERATFAAHPPLSHETQTVIKLHPGAVDEPSGSNGNDPQPADSGSMEMTNKVWGMRGACEADPESVPGADQKRLDDTGQAQ